jgi:hypothetical protein
VFTFVVTRLITALSVFAALSGSVAVIVTEFGVVIVAGAVSKFAEIVPICGVKPNIGSGSMEIEGESSTTSEASSVVGSRLRPRTPAGRTVIVVIADRAESPSIIAVIVTVCFWDTAAGAEYRPVLDMEPTVGDKYQLICVVGAAPRNATNCSFEPA